MSEHGRLLAALRAAPDDEVLRLAYADWLEELGDPARAEFIRRQCEGERDAETTMRSVPGVTLLEANLDAWLGPLAPLVGETVHYPPAYARFLFRRGLVEVVRLSARAFLERGEEIARWCPLLREAVLFRVRGHGADLARSPHLRLLDRLTVADWIDPQDARVLAASPHLGGLRSLRLWLGSRSDPAVCRHLGRGTGLQALEEVELVQLVGGLMAEGQGTRLNTRADRLAGEINRARGRALAHVCRPFERLFPLAADIGHGFAPGRLPDGRPALATIVSNTLLMAEFATDGTLIDVTRWGADQTGLDHSREEAQVPAFLQRELGFAPGSIRVREFATDEGLTVHLFPWSFEDDLRNPDERLPEAGEDEEGYEVGRWVFRWLEQGDFVIECGWDGWAGPDGRIHST